MKEWVDNKSIIKIFLIGVFILSAGSCKKFLEAEPPSSSILSEELFASDDLANSALAGVYVYLTGTSFASGDPFSLTSLAGLSADEQHYNNISAPNPDVMSFESNNLLETNSLNILLWQTIYDAIYKSNAILKNLDASTGVTATMKDRLRGEALFVRAFCHFYLVNVFGDVPLVTTTDYTINAKVTRIPQSQVYDQVEADLIESEKLLPEEYINAKRIRPVKAVATALLARLYLYRKDWVKAETNASKIISNSGVYELEANLNNVFLSGSREAIWQLKPHDNLSSTNEGYYFGPVLGPLNNVLTDTLVHSFQANDKRRTDWVALNGILYLSYKYKKHIRDESTATEYSMVFRLVEQYFIRAEARAQLDIISGNNSAESDINAIRRRAGLSDTTVIDLPAAMKIIENERKLEMFAEWGHRWFDLKRWNRATTVLKPLKPGWTEDDVLYPIPYIEMTRNPFLAPQNPGY